MDGDNTDAIHDMRVAIRRMRTVFELFGDSLLPFDINKIELDLRKTARRLGKVRDLDVLLEKTNDILNSLPEKNRFGLDSLTHYWSVNQRAAVLKSSAYLRKPRYTKLKTRIEELIKHCAKYQSKQETNSLCTDRVCYIAPINIYQQLACVRAYGPHLDSASEEMHHQLRIESKKLRYTIEFFQDILGEPVNKVISELKSIQDHLGDINDDVVAVLTLDEILSSKSHKKNDRIFTKADLQEIRKYRKFRNERKLSSIKDFKKSWNKFDSGNFRKNLALAISNL